MANTFTPQSATPNRLALLLIGDGTVSGPLITNAQLQAAMVDGPLKDAYNSVIATDGTSIASAMRKIFIGGFSPAAAQDATTGKSGGAAGGGSQTTVVGTGTGQGSTGNIACRLFLVPMVTVADTTAQINRASVDVVTDAVSTTKPALQVSMSDTTGETYMLVIEHIRSDDL